MESMVDDRAPARAASAGRGAAAGGTAAGSTAAVGRGRLLPIGLLLGYAGQVALRLLLTASMSFPTVQPDEGTYLVEARVLAGHAVTALPAGILIPGGYPLLLAPALALGRTPADAYHLVMVTNALLNSLVMPLVYLLLRRLRLSRGGAFLTALLIALLTPVLFYSEFAMADTVLPVLVLGWVVALHVLLSEGPTRRRSLLGAVAGLAAGCAMATHDRGTLIVVVTGALLLAALALRWAPRPAVLVSLAGLGAGVLGAELLSGYLLARFQAPPSAVADAVVKGLFDPHLLVRTAVRCLGQLWYFSVSSWGVGALGLVVAGAQLVRRRTDRATRILAGVLLTTFAGIDLAAAAALPSDHRIDDWVYARYLAVLLPVFFAIGAAGLSRYSRLWILRGAGAVTALTAGLGVLLTVGLGARLRTGVFAPWGMPDALFLGGNAHRLDLPVATAAGCGLLLLCAAATTGPGRRRALLPLALAGVALALAETVTVSAVLVHPRMKEHHFAGPGFTAAAGIRPGDDLVLDSTLDKYLIRIQPFQVFPGRTWCTGLSRGRRLPAGATVAVLPASGWPDAPPGWAPQLLLRDTDPHSGGYLVVWRRHQV